MSEQKERWRVWRADEPDGEMDYRSFAVEHPWSGRRLFDAQDAAEYWAQEHDQNTGDYNIVAQNDVPVLTVEDRETGERSQWKVEGEAVPQYYARPWKGESDAQ